MGIFFYCVTIALSERYLHVLTRTRSQVRVP